MNIKEFENISLRGRVAFGISCFENVLMALHYDVKEWKIVLEYLWEFTSIEYLDEWSEKIAEIIPDNLLEFKQYEQHDFEYLDKKTFIYLYDLYQSIDKKIDIVMTAIYNIGTSHAYTVIRGNGPESLREVDLLIDYVNKNNISLPNIKMFEQFSSNENKGWGKRFNGKELSCILQNSNTQSL